MRALKLLGTFDGPWSLSLQERLVRLKGTRMLVVRHPLTTVAPVPPAVDGPCGSGYRRASELPEKFLCLRTRFQGAPLPSFTMRRSNISESPPPDSFDLQGARNSQSVRDRGGLKPSPVRLGYVADGAPARYSSGRLVCGDRTVQSEDGRNGKERQASSSTLALAWLGVPTWRCIFVEDGSV